jgi:RND family efflux transporter MFP subunit
MTPVEHLTTSDSPAKQREPEPQPLHPPIRRIAIWGPLVVVTVLATFIVIGAFMRVHQRREQQDFAKKATQLTVNVLTVQRDKKPRELTLPANIEAFQETVIYPRVNGYVAKWLVDIGDNVQAGQLLAEIETPEIDQQLAQGRANFEIARVTVQRWKDLASKRVVAPQEFDEKAAAYEAAQANVRQLERTQGFKQIIAPFAGKITSRRVDVGALVSIGSGNAGTPLFGIAQTDPLRVYVYVPQTNAPSVHEGLTAKVLVQEFPGRDFEGTVTRTAGALDPASRTMQAEVQVPNHDGTLYSGMYGQVKFVLQDENAPLVISANAVAFRVQGPQVATVSDDARIHWQTVQVGRDFGTQIEVLTGLEENAKVVINPTDDLQEGLQVQVTKTEAAPNASPPQSGQQNR